MGIYDEYKQHFVNYALHSCLWNLTSLPQKQAEMLFDKLREEWFVNLEILDYGEEFYTNKEDYEQMLYISDSTNEYGYTGYIMDCIAKENQKLKDPYKLIHTSDNEWLSLDEIIEKLSWNREQRNQLMKKVKQLENRANGPGTAKYDNIKRQLDSANREITAIRSSWSFKVGRFFTWLPRKIRGLFRKH